MHQFPAGEYFARSKPRILKELQPAGQWNRLKVVVKGKSLTVTVNGKEVENHATTEPEPKSQFVLRPEGEMDFANPFVRELK